MALSAALKGRVANVRLSEPQPDRIRLIDVELHTTGEHLDRARRADREQNWSRSLLPTRPAGVREVTRLGAAS